MSRVVAFGRIWSCAEWREGRTATWPVVAFLIRRGRRTVGLYVRLGDHGWYLTRPPR